MYASFNYFGIASYKTNKTKKGFQEQLFRLAM